MKNHITTLSFTVARQATRFIALSGLLLIGSLQSASAQEYTQVTRLGTNEAICKGGIETREQLQSFFANDSITVGQILQDANWRGDQRDLSAEIAAGNFVEKSYAPGSRFDWMAASRKNVGVALPNREWAGKEAFVGYEVKVTSQCQVYTMVIPKDCCNLALFATEPAPVDTPNVSVSNSGNIVTACTEPGNQLMVIGADGNSRNVDLSENGCWAGVLPAGDYQFKATNMMCGGAETIADHTVAQLAAAVTEAAPVAAVAVVQAPKAKTLIPFIGAFVGSETRMRYEPSWDMDMEDSSGVFGIKAGLMKFVNPKTAIFGQVGYLNRTGVNEGNTYPDNNLFVDVGVDRMIGKNGFIGGGVGLWNVDDSDFDDESIFVHGGRNIGTSNAQWFVEGRVFADDTDDISSNNMYSAGIRYLFK